MITIKKQELDDGFGLVMVVTYKGSVSQFGTNGSRTRLKIIRQAEIIHPKVVRMLGYKWQRKFTKVVAERGWHLVLEGDVSSGRRLLLEAIKKIHVIHVTTWVMLRHYCILYR